MVQYVRPRRHAMMMRSLPSSLRAKERKPPGPRSAEIAWAECASDQADLTHIHVILYWNSPACARAARSLHATNIPVLVLCSMCILNQLSEFRIQNMHSTLYVYFQSISETCYLIFWCIWRWNANSEFWILKTYWKYIYIGWRALHESANSPVFRSVVANFLTTGSRTGWQLTREVSHLDAPILCLCLFLVL